MYDAILTFKDFAQETDILESLSVRPKTFFLATVHRPANTDNPRKLQAILEGFGRLKAKVVLAAHPRCRLAISSYGIGIPGNVLLIDPVGYLEMLQLEQSASAIFTDSGGVQKEAYLLRVPCITIRKETEWAETVSSGWNRLAGPDPDQITLAAQKVTTPEKHPSFFGDGRAAEKIVHRIMENSILEKAL
jgi:UDP-N-acetylglucosamine 2-epimerase